MRSRPRVPSLRVLVTSERSSAMRGGCRGRRGGAPARRPGCTARRRDRRPAALRRTMPTAQLCRCARFVCGERRAGWSRRSRLWRFSGPTAHPILESCLYCAAGTRGSRTAGAEVVRGDGPSRLSSPSRLRLLVIVARGREAPCRGRGASSRYAIWQMYDRSRGATFASWSSTEGR